MALVVLVVMMVLLVVMMMIFFLFVVMMMILGFVIIISCILLLFKLFLVMVNVTEVLFYKNVLKRSEENVERCPSQMMELHQPIV